MAYKINGSIIIDNSGNLSAGVATATLFDGKVSEKAITEQTAGSEADISGADEILLYDAQTNGLLRVSVDEFVVGSGIGTLLTEVAELTITGIATVGGDVNVGRNLDVVGLTTLGGLVTIGGTITPDTDVTYDLGSAEKRFKDIYLSGSTINLGGDTVSSVASELLYNGDRVVTKTGENIALTGDLTARNIVATGIVTATSFDGNVTIDTIDDIGDVDTTTVAPSDGNALIWDNAGGNWVPGVGPAFTVDAGLNVYSEQLIGTVALDGTANDNLFVGRYAGSRVTRGDNNVLLGSCAGLGVTSGINNVIVGNRAGLGLTVGLNNVIIGQQAGCTYEGSGAVFLGSQAGRNSSGSALNNIAIGLEAGRFLQGSYNVIMGGTAARCLRNGGDNIVLGRQSLTSSFTAASFAGSSNILIGRDINLSNVSASNHIVIGDYYDLSGAGPELRIGHFPNTWISGDSNYDVTIPNNLTVTGSLTATLGSIDTLSDVDTTTSAPSNGDALVWDNAGGNWVPGVGPAFDIDINSNVYAQELIGTASFTTGTDNTIIGKDSGSKITTASGNVVLGKDAATELIDGRDNVIIGTRAANNLGNPIQSTFNSECNIVIGSNALEDADDAIGNVAIGISAMATATDYTNNVALGSFALDGLPGSIAIQSNIVIGEAAAQDAVSTALNPVANNVIIGGNAARFIESSEFNTVIGNQAAQCMGANSSQNLAFGSLAGRDISGTCNIAIGRGAHAMLGNDGTDNVSNNIAIGTYSLLRVRTGQLNVAIGLRSGQYINSGGCNTLLGSCSGASITDGIQNTFVGHQAGSELTIGEDNAYFGDQVAKNQTQGVQNTIIGATAASSLLQGSYNNIMGACSGSGLTNANDNNVLGTFSMTSVATGTYNTVVGNYSGNCLTGSSSRNIILGSTSLNNGTAGQSNDNVVIGYGIEMPVGDGQLLIGNTNARWITGDSNFNVTVPNNLTVTGSINASFISADTIGGVPIRNVNAVNVSGDTLQVIQMESFGRVDVTVSLIIPSLAANVNRLLDTASFMYDGTSISAAPPFQTKPLNTVVTPDIRTFANANEFELSYNTSGSTLTISLVDGRGNGQLPAYAYSMTITEHPW